MTDNYGSDHPEHELTDHEQQMTEGHETEAWQGNQAPVDDFADHHAEEPMHEDAASVSEETEISEDMGDAEMHAAPKSSKLPLIAGAGLLLIIGAGLYWQFGMSHGTGTSNIALNRPPASNSFHPSAANNNGANPFPPSTLPSPSAPATPAYNAAGGNDVAPTTALVTAAQPAVPSANTPQNGSALPVTSPAPTPATPAAMAMPPAPAPTIDLMAAANNAAPTAPVSIPSTPTPLPAPVAPVATTPVAITSAASSAALDARMNALSGKVDDMQKSLDDATQKLTQVTTMLSNQMGNASAPNAAVDERLNKIEQQLMHLDHKDNATAPHLSAPISIATAPAPSSAPQADTASNTPDSMSNGVMEKPIAPMTASTRPKPSHGTHARKHHVVTAAKASTKTRHIAPVATTNATGPATPLAAIPHEPLVLRAATPNEAWVARDNTTSELRHVQVGDSLPNIGTIRGIHQSGEGWVIEGTQGTLR